MSEFAPVMTASAERHYPFFDLTNRLPSLDGLGKPSAAYERLGAETKAALLPACEFVAVESQVPPAIWALMRRREAQPTDGELAAPFPREHRALRHNLERLRREQAARAERLRAAYESALSWRVTRPLRGLEAALRGARRASGRDA